MVTVNVIRDNNINVRTPLLFFVIVRDNNIDVGMVNNNNNVYVGMDDNNNNNNNKKSLSMLLPVLAA